MTILAMVAGYFVAIFLIIGFLYMIGMFLERNSRRLDQRARDVWLAYNLADTATGDYGVKRTALK